MNARLSTESACIPSVVDLEGPDPIARRGPPDRPTTAPDDGLPGALPKRSEQVVIGPSEYVNGRVLRFAKHRASGMYFRFGEREAFLLQQLDGTHGFADVSAAYRRNFDTPLAPQSLRNALALFERRGLIATDEPVRPAATALDSLPLGPKENALSFRFMYWNPDAVIGRIAPYFRWLINGRVLALWAVLLLASELALLPHAGTLWSEAVDFDRRTVWLRVAILAAIYAGITLLHETGHALGCKRYGGEVREMGVMLRYFIFSAYTKLDDILLFHDRGQRVQVLAAGPLTSFSLIPIAFGAWLVAPPDSLARMVAVDVLVWFNLGCLLQLLPFLQSDCYFMLAQWLRMPDLRKDASAYLFGRLLAAVSGRRMPPMPKECAAHVVPVYVLYGLLSLAVTSVAMAYVLNHHAQLILHYAGQRVGLVVVTVGGVLLLWNIAFTFVPWARLQHGRLLR